MYSIHVLVAQQACNKMHGILYHSMCEYKDGELQITFPG
jgi:hypothetical protein